MKIILLLLFSVLMLTGTVPSPKETVDPIATKKQPSILFVFFDNADKPLQSYLKDEVSKFYGCTIDVDTSLSLPAEAYYKPKNRYRAVKLIWFLTSKKPVQYDKIVGFTNKDISITNGINPDHGIFGLGQCPGFACVVSSFRLKSDSLKCLNVALHELGHTFGLDHCKEPNCLMADANGKGFKIPPGGSMLCNKCKKFVNVNCS